MSGVRVLVGTRKGAFVLAADGKRDKWEHATQRRRSFVRFFACERDLSHDLPDTLLPDPVATGAEPLLIVGAMAGGSVTRPLVMRWTPGKPMCWVRHE